LCLCYLKAPPIYSRSSCAAHESAGGVGDSISRAVSNAATAKRGGNRGDHPNLPAHRKKGMTLDWTIICPYLSAIPKQPTEGAWSGRIRRSGQDRADTTRVRA